ncbi:hypothetical protein [Streptomyces mirabilis]|uniref:hypothetical protein n=1 Tax=Streptomyces mirabilis TaxID=68239 RepID=UPI0036C651B9
MPTFDYLTPADAVAASGNDAPGYKRIDGLKGVDADRIPNVIPEEPWRAHAHLDKFKVISRVEWAKDADPGTAEVFYADGTTELIRQGDLLCVERPITTPDEDKAAMNDESLPIEARRAAFRRHNRRHTAKEAVPAATQDDNGRPRRMARDTAETIHGGITTALADLNTWQDQHPNVADYRVTEALQRLGRAETLLSYLVDNTDPEGDAARAHLKASGFFGREEEPEDSK